MEQIQLIMIAMGVLSIALTLSVISLRAEVKNLRFAHLAQFQENENLRQINAHDRHRLPEYCMLDNCPWCEQEERAAEFEFKCRGFVPDEDEESEFQLKEFWYYQAWEEFVEESAWNRWLETGLGKIPFESIGVTQYHEISRPVIFDVH